MRTTRCRSTSGGASFPRPVVGPPAPGQTIEQVYFTGVHCDVGGGYPETGLSDITLAWMMGKAEALGVDFDPAAYALYANLDAKHALDLKHESWSARWGSPLPRTSTIMRPSATACRSACNTMPRTTRKI